MTSRGFRRLSVAAAGCVALAVGLGAAAAPGHAAEDCEEDCGDLIISIQSGPVVWEEPNPAIPNQVLLLLSERVAKPVTVWFQTADGTATAPEDYLPIDQQVTVPAGERAVAVPIEVRADGIEERDEFFTAAITEPSLGRIGIGKAEVTIRDGAPRERR